MTRMVNVLVLPPGEAAPIRTEKIDGDDYRELTRLVNGDLGTCSLPQTLRQRHYYAFCDDNGYVRSDTPEPNRWATHLGHARLAGPIVIVRTDEEGETLSLRRHDIEYLEVYLASGPSAEAVHAAKNEATWLRLHPSGIAILNTESGQWE